MQKFSLLSAAFSAQYTVAVRIAAETIDNRLMADFEIQRVGIIQRDDVSWLIEGAAPLEDVMRALDIVDFPNSENYETIGGFMMYSLRKIPKKTDFVLFDRYKFEIIDTDNLKIDQLLVSLNPEAVRAE